MKKNILILFLINIIFLQVSAQQFSIVIQDSVVVLNKKQDVVKLNLIIKQDVEDTIRLKNFFKYIKLPCFLPFPYIDRNGKLISSNQPGLYYYIQHKTDNPKNEDLLGGWGYDLSQIDGCEKRIICVDTLKMTYTVNYGIPCDNEKLLTLNQNITHFTVYPVIKYDYCYISGYKYFKKYVLRNNKEFYLTLYYIFPKKTNEEPLIITSNRVKLIIK
jgi:hypothetical protein